MTSKQNGIDREFYIELGDDLIISIFPDITIRTSIVMHEIEFYLEPGLPNVW